MFRRFQTSNSPASTPFSASVRSRPRVIWFANSCSPSRCRPARARGSRRQEPAPPRRANDRPRSAAAWRLMRRPLAPSRRTPRDQSFSDTLANLTNRIHQRHAGHRRAQVLLYGIPIDLSDHRMPILPSPEKVDLLRAYAWPEKALIKLIELTGWNIIIENKPGGTGAVGSAIAAIMAQSDRPYKPPAASWPTPRSARARSVSACWAPDKDWPLLR